VNTYLADDPELWEPGMVKRIPRIEGRSYPCIITRVTPTMIEFRGPTGDAAITRTLYTHLMKEQAA
jgi:hypothetical protein